MPKFRVGDRVVVTEVPEGFVPKGLSPNLKISLFNSLSRLKAVGEIVCYRAIPGEDSCDVRFAMLPYPEQIPEQLLKLEGVVLQVASIVLGLEERVKQLETELAYERHRSDALVAGNIPESADTTIILAVQRARGYLTHNSNSSNYYDAKSVYSNEETGATA